MMELFVDKNGDGAFSSDEVVASRLVDYPADSYGQVNLTYTDVQLSSGEYEYQARVSKNGQTTESFTNGTLNVTGGDDDGGSSTGNPLLDSNGEALGTTQVLMKLAEWSDTGGQNGGKIDGQNVGIQELLGYLGEWQETRQ